MKIRLKEEVLKDPGRTDMNEDNLILVKGAVPGPKKALGVVREAVKA